MESVCYPNKRQDGMDPDRIKGGMMMNEKDGPETLFLQKNKNKNIQSIMFLLRHVIPSSDDSH